MTLLITTIYIVLFEKLYTILSKKIPGTKRFLFKNI